MTARLKLCAFGLLAASAVWAGAGAAMAAAQETAAQGAAAAPAAPSFAPPPISAYAEIVERPLFSRARKAFAAPRPAPIVVAAPAPRAEAPRSSNIQLAGVIYDGVQFVALIKTNPSADLLEARQGEIIDGWTIDAIGAEEIRLRKAGVEDVVSLRDNALTAAQRRALASNGAGNAADRERARRLSQLQQRRRQRAEEQRDRRGGNNPGGG